MIKKRYKYLDPAIVARLSHVNLAGRWVVEGSIAGLHRSPFHGSSLEFAEHRAYTPGDDPRYIDWKVYGRSDKYYIKQYEEETNMKVYILLDISKSMQYKAESMEKLEYGCYLAAALSYLMLHQQDSLGLVAFDNQIRKYVPPKSGLKHLKIILDELSSLKPKGQTNISRIFHDLAQMIKKRGMIIVISDLYDDPEKVLAGLNHFRHKKHQVLVFHLLDRFELSFPFERMGSFEDMETGARILVDPRKIRDGYIKRLNEFIDKYKHGCRESRIDYVMIDTATHFDVALTAYLAKRSRIR